MSDGLVLSSHVDKVHLPAQESLREREADSLNTWPYEHKGRALKELSRLSSTWVAELIQSGVAIGIGQEFLSEISTTLGALAEEARLVPRDSREDDWSLSGAYGRGEFPWHTDGAISTSPPRWMVLQSDSQTSVGTELLDPDPVLLAKFRKATLRAADARGRVRYLPALVPSTKNAHRIRWDPRTCPATNPALNAEVTSLPASRIVDWRKNTVALVDNHRILHRRPAVQEEHRELKRFYIREES